MVREIGRVARHGFTLVEMMVAMTVTLILIFALAQVFAIVGDSVAEGRAAIEMAGSLRTLTSRLQQDLDSVTVKVLPWADDGAGEGYFEAFEGVGNDIDPLPELPGVVPQRLVGDSFGDIDDVLAMTIRSNGTPFRGFHFGTPIQSYEAEVIWFTRFEDRNSNNLLDAGEVFLYRRQLLVMPNFANPVNAGTTVANLVDHYRNSDLSVRLTPTGIFANSLADLSQRENRFGHRPTNGLLLTSTFSPAGFPFLLSRALLVPRGTQFVAGTPGFDGQDDNLDGNTDDFWEAGWFGSNDLSDTTLANLVHGYGHDLMQSNILTFDVKVFDPYAEIRLTSFGTEVVPGDPAWGAAYDNTIPPAGRGAFVDLGYRNPTMAAGPPDPFTVNHAVRRPIPTQVQNGISLFSGLPAFRDTNNNGSWNTGEPFLGVFNTPTGTYAPTFGTSYCTWSIRYERDGIDQDGDMMIDEGSNGLDDDPNVLGGGNRNGIVDDPVERETSPPYPFPLRGVQVSIRLLEPGTRQVRQMTVVADFIPE